MRFATYSIVGRCARTGELGVATRQLGVTGLAGEPFAWTGSECTGWCGHLTGEDFATQGNMLTGPNVLDAMAERFEAERDASLDERLLRVLAQHVHRIVREQRIAALRDHDRVQHDAPQRVPLQRVRDHVRRWGRLPSDAAGHLRMRGLSIAGTAFVAFATSFALVRTLPPGLVAREAEPLPDAASRVARLDVLVDGPDLIDTASTVGEPLTGVSARWSWVCEAPEHLARLDVALFEPFPRLAGIDVALDAPAGDGRTTLVPGRPVLELGATVR